jgi:hypothetical protein
MFEWLVDELARVNTRKFYLMDGALPADKWELMESSQLPIPPSYKDFVRQFGNAKLYRLGSQYRVQVYAVPIADETEKGEPRLCFGRTEDTVAYFKESLLVPSEESPVFEWHYEEGIEQQTANGFEEWLRKKCAKTRRTYTKKEWREIEKGPPPFNDQETRIVVARRKFRWRVVGISSNGAIQYEVYNGSDMVLPFLTIGIRGKRRGADGTLEGGAWLPVGSVLPGQTAVIERDSYIKWVDPQDVEAFEKPDPEPEDRDRYWEFKTLPM